MPSPPERSPGAAGPEVTAVVVSHDSGADLRACVDDLLAQDLALEVIVVDNASRDGSLEQLPGDARLRVLRNPDNRGFAAACNQGAALGRALLLLFINPDCRLATDAVARMRQHLLAHPDVGLLGARLLDADGSPQAAAERRTPDPRRAIRHVLGLESIAGASSDGAERAAGAPGLRGVEATSGALMMLRREQFRALGGMDEGYRLHCEDLDLCRRVLLAGWRVAIATDVPVVHLKGTSSRRRPVWVEWQKHRGMWRYFRKFDAAHSPWWLRGLVAAGLVGHFPLAAVRAWLRRAA